MKRALALIGLVAWSSCGLGPIGGWTTAAPPPVLIGSASDVVALPSGRVLVFGGFAQLTGQPVPRTLIYDPGTDRWSTGASIPETRFNDTAAVLRDGSVLVAGGYGANPQGGGPPVLRSTYLYDPGADSWRRAGDLVVPTAGAAGVALSDGRILLVGGANPLPQPVDNGGFGLQFVADGKGSEIFDPNTGMWSDAGSLLKVQSGAAYAPLPGGGALVAGGCSASDSGSAPTGLDMTEVFLGTSRAWRPSMRMPEPRCGAKAVPLPDGRVLIIGGFAQAGATLDDAVVFDPRSDSWSAAGQIAMPSSPAPFNGSPNTVATRLASGRVLVPVVQLHQQSGPRATLWVGGEAFDPASKSWSSVTTASVVTDVRFGAPEALGAAALPGDRALVLLENNALIFEGTASPPATTVLDSSSVTELLLAISGALVLMIVVVYAAGRRRT